MKKGVILVLCLFSAVSFLYAQGNEPVSFRPYSVSDGLSNNVIYSILQDHLGLMWFGTEDGLNTFDGYQFYQFKCNPSDSLSLSNNIIRCLYEDKQHLIWVGTDNGLNVFNPYTGKFTQYKNTAKNPASISSNLITAISEDASGNIWVGTSNKGLNEFNKETGKFTRFSPDNFLKGSYGTGWYISAVLADNKTNKIWVGTPNGLLLFDPISNKLASYQNTNLHLYPESAAARQINITSLYKDKSGSLWIGTLNDGLNKLDESTGKFISYKNNPSDPNSLSENSVFSICEDLKGQLWIGTLGGGLNIFNPKQNTFQAYSADTKNDGSLSSNLAWSVCIDDAGTAWIGTSMGLNTYDRNRLKFTTLQVEPGKTGNNNVFSIYKDHENNLWLGVLGGGLCEYDLKSNRLVNQYKNNPANSNSLSNNDVFCIYEDHTGLLWIGTYNGLNAFDKKTGKFTVYKNTDESSLSNNYVTSIVENANGELWVGTFGGGINILDRTSGKFQHFSSTDKSHYLSNDNVTCIFQDANKTMWVGAFGGGLNKFNPANSTFTSFKNIPADSKSLSNDYIYCINEDRKGTLWIGTYGGGLNSLADKANGAFTRYDEANGLTNNIIAGILTDAANHIWLSTNNGIIEFSNEGGDKVNTVMRSFDERDGLQYKYNPRACFKSDEDALFFGGTNGFNAFYANGIINNPNKPPVVITRFKVFDKEFSLDSLISRKKRIDLSFTQKFFSFEFAGLNYAFPEKNKYAYKLEGFDKDWIESGNRRYAAYTNLGAGTYTFRVKAANNDGVWNDDGTAVTIIIHPPFWKTWWFYLIDAFVFILTIVTFIQVRTRSLTLQNKEMERKVQLRTSELQSEKEKTEQKSVELEKTLRHLEATQDQLIQSEKMASLGALTAGIAHEIQNPLNFVNNYSEVSTELIDELQEEPDEEKRNEILKNIATNLQKVNQHGKRADRIVKAMLMHSRAEAGEKEPTDINALCEEAVNLSYPAVKANVPDFRCEVVKNLSSNLPLIKIARQDVSRVVLNLLNNAFYAVDERNRKAASENNATYKAQVTITTSLNKGFVNITIRDNGNGIPASIKEKIFQPFFTTKPSGVGTGLGLSISYDIIKSHGGELTLDTKEGVFTEFIISLPA